MKPKRLLCLLMALSLLFCLYGCKFPTITIRQGELSTEPSPDPTTVPDHREEQTAPASISPLLYRVTDADGNVAWLFGSIHLGYDYFYPLPEYVNEAYENADAIAFEFDIKAFEEDMDAQMDAMTMLMYTDGTTIRDHISQELYEESVAILKEYGYYVSYLDYYLPIMWSSFLDQCLYEEMEMDAALGIDTHLIERAYADGKEVLEVESAEFQYGMMADFSPELQELLLEGSVAYFSDLAAVKEDMKAMVELWANGDEAAFAAYLTEEGEFSSEEERKLYEEYNNAMIVERNNAMTDYAETVLKSGKEVFICVGAAHIVGEGAMADLLRQRGYTVELVQPTAAI